MSMLRTIFGADTSRLEKGLDRANGRVTKFSRGIQRQLAAAFSVAAITMFFRRLTNDLDRIGKLAARGFSTDFIQDLGLAADLAGTSVERLLPRITRLFQEINSGVTPSRQMTDALETLGLSVSDLEGLSPENLFNRLTRGLTEAEDKSRAMAAAQTILRDRTGELAPLLQSIAENGLPQAARASEETIRTAEKLKDTWAILSNQITGIAAPALLFLTKAFMWLKAGVEIVGAVLGAFAIRAVEQIQNLVTAAGQLLKLDFKGFRRTIQKEMEQIDIMFDTMSEGFKQAKKDLDDFNAELEKERTPFTMTPDGLELDDEEQTVTQKVKPSALADSLQQIGGGGMSVVAVQRDEAIRLAGDQLAELKGIRDAIQELESERMR